MKTPAKTNSKDHLIAKENPEGILLRPAVISPIEIYSLERTAEFDEAEADLAVWSARHDAFL